MGDDSQTTASAAVDSSTTVSKIPDDILFYFLISGAVIAFFLILLIVCKVEHRRLKSNCDRFADWVLGNYKLFVTILIFVIVGSIFHFFEVAIFGRDSLGHSVGDTVIITIIAIIVSVVSIIGLFETIKKINEKSDKIDDYRVFYKACARLFKDTKDTDHLYFCGGTLVPGAFFIKNEKHTKVKYTNDTEIIDNNTNGNNIEHDANPDNNKGYYLELKNLIKRHAATGPESGKEIKLILPICNEDSFKIYRKKLCGDDENCKTDELYSSTLVYENYKALFYKDSGNDYTGKLNVGVVNYGEGCIDYYLISNGKNVVFATTLNDKAIDRPVIVGINSDNPVLVEILEDKFRSTWKSLESDEYQLTISEGNPDDVKNFVNGDVSGQKKDKLKSRIVQGVVEKAEILCKTSSEKEILKNHLMEKLMSFVAD